MEEEATEATRFDPQNPTQQLTYKAYSKLSDAEKDLIREARQKAGIPTRKVSAVTTVGFAEGDELEEGPTVPTAGSLLHYSSLVSRRSLSHSGLLLAPRRREMNRGCPGHWLLSQGRERKHLMILETHPTNNKCIAELSWTPMQILVTLVIAVTSCWTLERESRLETSRTGRPPPMLL